MQKDPGEKRVGVFQEPNRRQPHLDFRTSTPFMKTRQAQSVYCLVCSRLNNPTKHMRLVCFPYLGQVGFPRFLCIADLREFLIGPGHKKKPRLEPQQRLVVVAVMRGDGGAVTCGFHSFQELSLNTGLGTEHAAGNEAAEDLMRLPVPG